MKNRFAPKKKTSDCQDRIETMPSLYAEFQSLERAFSGTYGYFGVGREFEQVAQARFNDLDRLFGFEGESQMRKVGVESSQWAGRR